MSLFKHPALLGILILFNMITAHSPATVPGIIVNSFLPRGFNGTVYSLAADINHDVYASCFDPTDDNGSSAFILKLDAVLHTVWTKKLETFPATPATIAFSATMGLYAVVSMKNSETNTIEIWVFEIDADDGKTLQAVQVDSVESIVEVGLQAFVATSERERPTLYVSYVMPRISQRDTVTKVLQLKKMDSGVLFEQWRTEIYNASRAVVSHAIEEYIPGQGVYVAQITRKSAASITDMATITMIDKNGSTMLSGSFPTMTENAKISCFESDDNGLMFFSESPSHLHHLAMTSLNKSHRITKLWSESSIDIAAMHVLRNGSLLYILADAKAIRNNTSSADSETVPVFVVYNNSGAILLTERHDELNSGVERILRTFAMRNEALGPAIVLGGHFSLARSDGRLGPSQISLSTYIFPISAFETQEALDPSPVPQVPSLGEESTEGQSRYRRFAIGISCGICAAVVVVGLMSCLRRRRATLVSKLSRNARHADQHVSNAVTGISRIPGSN